MDRKHGDVWMCVLREENKVEDEVEVLKEEWRRCSVELFGSYIHIHKKEI